jgi:hypothetical protein
MSLLLLSANLPSHCAMRFRTELVWRFSAASVATARL